MMRWTPDHIADLRMLWAMNPSPIFVMRMMGLTKCQFAGASIRYNLHRAGGSKHRKTVPVSATRTLYLRSVRDARDAPKLLMPGYWNPKLGKAVMKGAWRGMPIYSLTLEERATCPSTCRHWKDCMGNQMPFAARNRHGPELEHLLELELAALQHKHRRKGFVVRLHVLGDFYSTDYVSLWLAWLDAFPALRVWGYTARSRDSEIGRMIDRASAERWDRFAVRFSNDVGARSTMTSYQPGLRGKIGNAIVCPAQTEDALSCATCTLCWSTQAPIIFLAH